MMPASADRTASAAPITYMIASARSTGYRPPLCRWDACIKSSRGKEKTEKCQTTPTLSHRAAKRGMAFLILNFLFLIGIQSKSKIRNRNFSVPVRRFPQDSLQLVQALLNRLRIFGFEVQPQQRLGVALADVEPPVAVVDGDAVEVIDLS